MNDMGPRSLFVRLPPASLDKIAGSALDHMGDEEAMRKALGDATAGLLGHLTGTPHLVSKQARAGLIGLANLVSQSRSPVHRDYKGEIELVGDAEAPTRIIKQLGQLWRACGVLGLGAADSWEVNRIVAGPGHADGWELSGRARAWLAAGDTLPEMLEPTACTRCGEPLDQSYIDAGFTDHGEDETP